MLAEVTGVDDGRTYKGIIQQISWTLGDLNDEVVLNVIPLTIATSMAGSGPRAPMIA